MALRFAGSIVLALFLLQCSQNGVNSDTSFTALFSHGTQHGDQNIDTSVTNPITLPFNISFLDHKYSTLIISNDGTVAFENNKEVAYDESKTYFGGVRNPASDVPFIAPLLYKAYRPQSILPSEYQGTISYRVVDNRNWATGVSQEDADLIRNLNQYLPSTVVHAPENFDLKFLIIITWENVAEGPETQNRFCRKSQPCNSTTFQLALAGNESYTFAIFNYGKYNISVQYNYEAGINAGKGRGWYNVLPCHGSQPCAAVNPAAVISNLSNIQGSDLYGRFIFSVGQEAVIRGGCLSPELNHGILEVYPRSVGMFGGEKLEFSTICSDSSTVLYCRFGAAADRSSKTINATIVNTMKGFCPVPPLATTGHLDLYVINANKAGETTYRGINVVIPSRLQAPVAIDSTVKQQWYSKDSKEITVRWDSNKFSTDGNINVDIKLIGYREYANQIEYRELVKFGSVPNRLNSYTFNVEEYRCKLDCEVFEIGLLEVSLPSLYHGTATERVAVRYGPIPLGWYVNQELENTRGSDWSNQKCREWHDADSRDSAWIKDLLPCPCNLNQALADFGRWQADPGCNLFTGSQCTFHKGAKHCVRSVAATVKDGAGNQCCYNSDGTLSHSQLSYQGSTPDRSHVWGVYPYNSPNRVPELSHWKHDVTSFFYCCLWNNNELCDLYMELRPTSNCQNYDVPGIGFIHGQTHLRTFDGLTYHLVSAGDYWLAQHRGVALSIQGKFEARAGSWDFGQKTKTTSWHPRALTGIAISGGRDKIEVSLALEGIRQRRALDIRVGGEIQYFLDTSSFWQDFQDSAIVNNAASVSDNYHNNFTILLTKLNVGLTVTASNGLLHVAVAVPPSFKPQAGGNPNVQGLLGAFDGSAENDFINRQSRVISPTRAKKEIFDNFIWTWQLTNNDTRLFRFQNPAEELEAAHSYFEYNQIPADFSDAPTASQVSQLCGTSDNCKWDYQITGEEIVARATRDADDSIRNFQRSAAPVESCGLPEVGNHVILSTENFSPGINVRVTGCTNDQSVGSDLVFSCLKETLEEARQHDRANYGIIRTNITTNVEYIIHWIPQPYTVCSDDTDEASNLPLIIGATVGGVVVLIIIVVVVVVVIKKRKSGSSSPKEKTPSERRKKQVETDPGSADAMLSRVEDRSPVYKPSKEPVRMSEVQGSNV